MTFRKMDMQDQTRPEGRNCILAYGFSPEEGTKLAAHAVGIGIWETILLDGRSDGMRLLEILEDPLAGTGTPAPEPAERKAVVFHAVSQEELHRFIRQFSLLGMERPLFAMVTPVSAGWRLGELIGELQEERKRL
ncbi:DUF3783 domain-containing protein [Anaerotalea alkaliphila]|uniref:DUF3783 domain-containing protein n=1 Tax=Anaerotalea alkaliphila TaxID=2662126 RepID=A0A7X5HUI3_9FIRM|nr:DUF3783 domain-containing protein [Anaerotalea alkaliphila]NDL66935.1 DUF3783 domain-containing protein [Anaerotalea alkaliphila]